MARIEICLSGSGGQGLLLAGKILGEAVALYSDRYVVQTQSYGPEARGGASRAEIVIDDDPIDYPKVVKLDLLLALTQQSCDKYIANLKEDGLLVIDPFGVKNPPKGKYRVFEVPVTQLSISKLGKPVFGNIIALGALSAITDIIPVDQLEKAVFSHVPEMTRPLNVQALGIGYETGKEIRAHS